MTEATPYKFETKPGLPPDGDTGQYLGLDADASAYILWWDARGYWCAVGRDPVLPSAPVAMAADRVKETITSHAALPLRWSEVD